MDIIMKIQVSDNVAVAIKPITKDQKLNLGTITIIAEEYVESAHKISIRPIKKGEQVIKYGYPIGVALCDILPGQWVHTHNLGTSLQGIQDYKYSPLTCLDSFGYNLESQPKYFFKGYKRYDGLVGTRNDIWIIPTVSCVNTIAITIAKRAKDMFLNTKIDGFHALTHPYGCSQLGDDLMLTQKILAGLVNHPNAGGVLVVGLGCENNNIGEFKRILSSWNPNRVKFLIAQDSEDELEEGLKNIRELVKFACKSEREEIPISELIIGTKCGGSDAFSGITANPLVGKVSDILIAEGGTSVLTEVPEMFGAEHILMNRAINREIFKEIVNMINGFKEYFIRYKQPIYENPAPGNKDGGISTLEEKSLGCILKGGTSAVTDVLRYGDKVKVRGLNMLEAPGNDLVSLTALVASGCQLILFTTGRGNPLGTCVPTIKISTNTRLAKLKKSWIDFDAGILLKENKLPSLSEELLYYILVVASGLKFTMNELNNCRDIGILKDGVTL
jgi:altronate hydrolase